jgi:formylglycine-generating enzyme required for sulfatase activity
MPDNKSRPLRVFLCHAHEDKAVVRDLYRQLCAEGWLDVWPDEEKLLPGQEWDIEIEKAVEAADVVLVCLSCRSADKEGYIQKELRFVLNIAQEKPEGTLFIIPLKLEECPVPRRLRAWQWVDYFPRDRRAWAYQRLMESLKLRAARLGIPAINAAEEKARLEAEERARREAMEIARRREQERKAAEDLQRKQFKDKARREKKEQERMAAEERARKAAKEPQLKKVAEQSVERKVSPVPSSQPRQKATRKINFVPFGIGAIVLLVVTCGIFGINYIITHWPTTNIPTPTEQTPAITSTDTVTPTWRRPADGMVMVFVPAGNFLMGSTDGDIAQALQTCPNCDFSDEKPQHTVYLDSFWVDQTEVTNRMYALCVAAEKCDPHSNSSSSTHSNYYGNSEYDDYPVIYVSWNDASDYCAWAGGDVYDVRLPTEAEWEKAARGTDGRTYPWGNDSPSCSAANYSGCVGDTTAVGSYESGQSPYGAYDLAGNVWEWVADWYSGTYYLKFTFE